LKQFQPPRLKDRKLEHPSKTLITALAFSSAKSDSDGYEKGDTTSAWRYKSKD
jgi:hypothetical protein